MGEIKNKGELTYEISDIVGELQGKEIKNVKVSHVLEEVYDVALQYGLRMPMSFVLFGKTIITLEGIALEYDPKFRIISSSKPFVEELMAKRYSPVYVFNSFMKSMFRFRKFAEELPEQTTRALKRIEKGTIHVDIEDTDIKRLSLEIDRSGNRVAYSMLTAALLIVGALTIDFGSPVVFNIPLVPFLSFLAALLLSFILLFSILREKNIIE